MDGGREGRGKIGGCEMEGVKGERNGRICDRGYGEKELVGGALLIDRVRLIQL